MIIQTKKDETVNWWYFLMKILIAFSWKLLVTLVKSLKKKCEKKIILVMLQVSSLQFYLKWTVLHMLSKIVPRFTYFVKQF